eukprot:4436674-Ditylum_brightwellii.AAC.1
MKSIYHLISKKEGAPASASKLLTRELDAPKFDGRFYYRQMIGKLNYLEKESRGDISFAIHQCARFCGTYCSLSYDN